MCSPSMILLEHDLMRIKEDLYIWALPLIYLVALTKSLTLSDPQLSPIKWDHIYTLKSCEDQMRLGQ